jgi:cysteinyl-tRNA synthetase
MKLYNTLTRKIEELAPLHAPEVTVYTCGPTVYDYAHVGHWFTYIRWDLLVRTLRVSGLQPNWVMNITDVGHLVSDADDGEDKLEKGARREGKTAWEVAAFYTKDFLDEMDSLTIQRPTHLTKATDHIVEQIELIQKLEDKGFTYVIDDGVYYDTSKFPRYGELARLDIEEQQAGARVVFNEQKRNATDFALWKFSPKDQQRDMEWDSPWGKGFPGWHIECSAMSMKYLGDTLDIHTGGIDHIPVHHTNEIAQSEAVTGKRFAQVWLHSNHVLIEGEKISKSLGNGIRLKDIAARGISLEAFRLHVLESHYRSQSKFSWDSLEAAQNRLKNWQATASLRWQATDDKDTSKSSDIKAARESLRNTLAEDLNTPEALAVISNVFSKLDASLLSKEDLNEFESLLINIDEALGLQLHTVVDISSAQKDLIAAREEARNAKDWVKSDEIRQKLTDQGISLRDTPYGSVWYRN